eukprot:5671266-Pyramimonas_sp.AAC.1
MTPEFNSSTDSLRAVSVLYYIFVLANLAVLSTPTPLPSTMPRLPPSAVVPVGVPGGGTLQRAPVGAEVRDLAVMQPRFLFRLHPELAGSGEHRH